MLRANLIVMVLVAMACVISEVFAQLIFLFTVKRIQESGQRGDDLGSFLVDHFGLLLDQQRQCGKVGEGVRLL